MSSCRTVDFKNEEVKRCLMKVQLDLLRLFQSLSNSFVGLNSHVFIVVPSFEKLRAFITFIFYSLEANVSIQLL